MVLCRHMLRKSHKFPRYIFIFVSFCVYFVCALFQNHSEGKTWAYFGKPSFYQMRVWEYVSEWKKIKLMFHALLLPSVFTKWTLFSRRIIWLHVKRVKWVKDRTVTLRNWTYCDSCTENEFMSILSDFFHSSWGRGIIFGEICIMEP